MGMNGWRRVCFYEEISQCQDKACRLMDSGPSEAHRLLKLLKADGVDEKTHVNVDTMKRYLSLARRLKAPVIRDILSRCEALSKREMLDDNITTLRQVCGATENEADLACVMEVLMLEQTSGLRKKLKVTKIKHEVKTPGNIAKAVLVRRQLFTHISETFPKFKDDVKQYLNKEFYKMNFQVNEFGVKEDEQDDVHADEVMSDDTIAQPQTTDEMSTYTSRRLIKKSASQSCNA